MNSEIIVVSGLPRSGTSLMMQMLDKGGIEVVTDVMRQPDVDNPQGYYEFEQVKKLKEDASWIPHARGKAVKIVSQLLYDLPASEKYRVIFMERNLEEVLASQEKMLARLNRPAVGRDQIRSAFVRHLEHLRKWVAARPFIAMIAVDYHNLVARPREEAERISAFLSNRADALAMAEAVDPTLYRNRKTSG
jgi:hypothetical protein